MIRAMELRDKAEIIEMMRVFYASPAVLSNGSEEIFLRDIDQCLGDLSLIHISEPTRP